jgi:hypothetical protein
MSNTVLNATIEVTYDICSECLYCRAEELGLDLDGMSNEQVGRFALSLFADASEVGCFGSAHKWGVCVEREIDE